MKRTGNRITDDMGRTLILRGVNLGGSSKIPSFGDSFVGRPFPIEKSESMDCAEEHFDRLKNWGLTFVRFIICWEALEHAGPGIYDESYLDYLQKLLVLAEKKGISVYMDPHQDVWSRCTGGDGAPVWTLEKLGMDPGRLEAVGALAGSKKAMVWPVNYSFYAVATMFTLFFAGNVFAPELKIEGESAQDWLQERYIAAFNHCFKRLKDCKAVVGWGIMNEPHPGLIGHRDLQRLDNTILALGPVPSPFQAMMAASGHSVQVPVYTPWLKGWKVVGKKTINPYGLSLFKEGFSCPWKQAGVWSDEGGSGRLLKPDHFSNPSTYQGKPLSFCDDFLKPFVIRFIERMSKVERSSLFFIEGVPHRENPSWKKEDPQNVVNAFHHYDGFSLFTKSFRPWLTLDAKMGRIILGKKKTAAHFSAKLAEAVNWARENMGDMPCLLGEFGLAFDLNNKTAYKTGDYSLHEKALSVYYDGIDENLLSSTIWNYTADNNNLEGDHWNAEDLSIVSNGKPRAQGGWLRPYPMATAGIPLKISWVREKAIFCYRFKADPEISAPTEIFIPSCWYGESPNISINTINTNETTEKGGNLRAEYLRQEQRLLVYNDGYADELEICVK